jgi:hypothetical protein
MNGRIIVLGTDTVFHPLRTWTSEFQGRNGSCILFQKANHAFFVIECFHRPGFAAREGAIGIYALDTTRTRGDISGESMPFQFAITDNTRGQGDPRHAAVRDGKPYKVDFAPPPFPPSSAHRVLASACADAVLSGEDFHRDIQFDARGIL